MVHFHEIRGALFKEAKAKLEACGPSQNYMASAIGTADGQYYAAYAAPGWIPSFVYAEDGLPYIFRDFKPAEAMARELLFNELNANLREGWIDGLREDTV